jgi:two-component system nitrate/nitrite response regulator NarL
MQMCADISRTIRLNGGLASSKARTSLAVPAKLVLFTRHELTAAGLKALLQAGGHYVLASCTLGDELLRSLQLIRPDILLLDMVPREAVAVISQMRAEHHSLSIILMLDERDTITAASLLALDVEGILLGVASATNLLHCVESVRHGGKWVDPGLLRHMAIANQTAQIAGRLTNREADIANLVSRGLHNKQIARELHVTEGTVKMHLHHIYEKLHLNGRTELALSIATMVGKEA